jgi:uncharacterized damage-inducible protein DinB
MTIITPILGELDHESKTTRRVLERVPQEQLEWAPHPRSMTLRRLAWHLAVLPANAVKWLRAGVIDRSASPTPPVEPPQDVAEIVAAFDRNSAEAREYLATLDDATLKEPISMVRDGQTMITFSKIQLVRTVLMNHSYHHRGQLSVYLRLLDVPVPSIYGSSADEPM